MASTVCVVHACSPSHTLVSDVVASSSSSPVPYALLSLNNRCYGVRRRVRFPFQQRRGVGVGVGVGVGGGDNSGSSRRSSNGRSRLRGVILRAHLGQLPEPQHVDLAITALSHHVPFLAVQDMLVKAQGLLYTLADATAATTDAGQTAAVDAVQKQSGDWLSGVTSTLEVALTVSDCPLSFRCETHVL